MSTRLEEPEVERYLRPLKPFQRDAVDHIFRQLFRSESPSSQARFLLADEVGLGKTLVARGVIARAVQWYQNQDNRDNRVDIVYICSNRNIASQNVNRLNVTENDSLTLPTRLTMLPLRLPEIRDNDVNFISLTPGTSFDLASREGRYEERVLLYHMLREVWGIGSSKRYINLLRCRKGHDRWRREVKKFRKEVRADEKQINEEIVDAFGEALGQEEEKSRRDGSQSLREKFEEAAELYTHKRTRKRPELHREAQKEVVVQLRRCLADVSVDYLTADLVVLDEFQRFKSLLDGEGTDAQLAQRLFESAKAKGRKTRLLLLSATPYKMYTTYDGASGDDHYEDFFRTLGFLFGEDENKERYQSLLQEYRFELLGSNTDEKRLGDLKSMIESILRQVMLRTERFKEIQDREGLVDEIAEQGSLTAEDIDRYASAQQLKEDYDVHNFLKYWKSAPYLPSFMGESYKLKDQIVSSLGPEDTGRPPLGKPSRESLQVLEKLSVDYRSIQDYEQIELPNSRVRELVRTAITGPQSWRILWTPASLPYWKHRGPYRQPAKCGFTKSLVFSGWKVVPNAVSVLGTYEAERRMMSASKYGYEAIGERASRLTFQLEDGKPAEMASMSLFYPCLSLARCVDPARLASRHATGGSSPTYQTIRSEAAGRIESLLNSAGIEVSRSGRSEIRHFWKYMAYLDGREGSARSSVRGWLNADEEPIRWQSMVGREGEAKGFSAHVDRMKEAFEGDRPPAIAPEAVERLADVAINAPATAALRALIRNSGDAGRESLPALLGSAARIAMGFRRRFNQPWIIESLTAEDSSPYWEIVLDHCRDGNLQSVLDEFYHVIRESEGLIDHSPGEVSRGLADYTQSVLSVRPASLNVETFSAEKTPHLETHKMRTHFALRLSDDKEILDSEDPLRGDTVRRAFNSPFHPFILATTSIGKEGLDFHQFCHSIFHWNLPSNPIDLEQREGRINRYKGHVIRRNVAESFGLPGIPEVSRPQLVDPWQMLFKRAEKEVEGSTRGLQPNWIYEDVDAFKIRRHVPSIPFSQDVGRLQSLKEDLMYYRLAFGQPRQQDLIDHLQRKYASLPPEEVQQKVQEQYIDLSPPEQEG